jgi:hypothetical protein
VLLENVMRPVSDETRIGLDAGERDAAGEAGPGEEGRTDGEGAPDPDEHAASPSAAPTKKRSRKAGRDVIGLAPCQPSCR